MVALKQLCVVAGAGPGVGLAVAKRFAREGYAIALLARRPGPLAAMAEEIEREGGSARSYPCDLTDLAAVRHTLQRIVDEMGAPAVLVWNGGRWIETPVLALDPGDFEAELRLTVVGALVAIQAVADAMARRGGGTVLVTGGGLALAPQYGTTVPALTAGKAAARAFVHAAAPGLVDAQIHLATVTIAGVVAPGTAFDPAHIADAFFAVHAEPASASDRWTTEFVFDGGAPSARAEDAA